MQDNIEDLVLGRRKISFKIDIGEMEVKIKDVEELFRMISINLVRQV